MKHAKRKVALERMHVLISNAISNARLNPDLAQRQASLARRISTHYRIKMPYELRINFCKKCKNFIAPGICLLYTSPSPRDLSTSRMPSSA